MTVARPLRLLGLPLAGLLVLGVALSAGATTVASGRINDVEVTDGAVQLLYSSSGLPDGVGLDPASVEVRFQPSGEEPVSLDARAESLGGQPELARQTALLVVDVSGSLGSTGIQAVRDAATTFLDAVPAPVDVGLVTFGDEAQVLVPATQDRQQVRDQVALLVDDGNTALYDAVLLAVEQLPGDGVERLIVLTDGQDDGSQATIEQAVAAVSGAGVGLTAVAFGEGAGQDALRQLAEAGQGQVVDAAAADELAGAFEAVAENIATDLVITAQVPEELAGRRGNLLVSAQAGEQRLETATFTTLAAPPGPDPVPSAEPSAEPVAAAPPQAVPRVELQTGSPTLYAGLAGLFLALLVVVVVLVGAFASRTGPEAQRRRSLAVYSMKGAGSSPRLVERESQGTKLGNNAVARSAVELAGRVVERRNATEKLAVKLDAANVPLRPAEWVVLRVAIAAASGLMLLLLSQGNVLAMLLGLLLGVVGPPAYLSFRRRRREKAFEQILPDTLALMASGLRAGYSLPQAMDSVVREGRQPIQAEFNRALVEARLGVPAEDALEGVATRMGSQDFRWVVMAIRIQREVGGNLAELLDTVSTTIRERGRLRRLVDTLSAEGRLSAWILGLLPVAFTGYLLVVQPEYLAPLVREPLGILLLVVALVVFTIGVLGLRWAIKVEV